MSLDVTDAASADKDGVIQPPIFVRYENSGVVAFKDVEQALQNVKASHLRAITGAWDRTGLPLRYEDLGSRLVLTASSSQRQTRSLRDALVERLEQDGATGLEEMNHDELGNLSNQRLRLKTFGELWKEAAKYSAGE